MFEIHVDTRIASVKRREKITAGSVGIQCNFAFSGDWDGLGRVAVFETDKHKISVELFTPVVTIPWEVCEEAGLDVIVGVYGTNGTGTIVIPTIYAKLGTVSVGTTTEDAENAQAPTSSDVQQIMSAAAGAVNTANNANSTAAQAVAIAQSVEARANAGEFDGEDGYSPVASVYRDDENKSVTVVITDKDGTHAATVFDGKDGMTPQLTIGSVETRGYGYPAEVTITGGIEKPVLNFELPQGPMGNPGKDYVLTWEDKEEIAWLAGVDKANKNVAYFNGAQIVDGSGYEVPFVELENWFVEDPSLVYIYYNEQAYQLYSASGSQIVFAADYPVGGKMQKHLITVPRRGAVTTTDIDIGDYSKPSTGIPESDLSAEVQTKLNSGGGSDVTKDTVKGWGFAESADLADVATSGSYSDLADKPTIPEAVSDDHIKSVAETESIKSALADKADKSEIPDVPVTDVQVHGTSILADGVANIPIAAVKTIGVVAVPDWSGIGVFDNGNIYIINATLSEMQKRDTNVSYKPITPRNLDQAVKLAMCDGKGAAWTAEEQLAAQARLGIVSSEGVGF